MRKMMYYLIWSVLLSGAILFLVAGDAVANDDVQHLLNGVVSSDGAVTKSYDLPNNHILEFVYDADSLDQVELIFDPKKLVLIVWVRDRGVREFCGCAKVQYIFRIADIDDLKLQTSNLHLQATEQTFRLQLERNVPLYLGLQLPKDGVFRLVLAKLKSRPESKPELMACR